MKNGMSKEVKGGKRDKVREDKTERKNIRRMKMWGKRKKERKNPQRALFTGVPQKKKTANFVFQATSEVLYIDM